jgi:hypothetical protein
VEIEQLLEATLAWGLADGINRWTYHCLFGLLAATGMRVPSTPIEEDRFASSPLG